MVIKLAIGSENKEHCITMDTTMHCITSILLFKELLLKGIYATKMCRSNCIGLSIFLKNTRGFKRRPQSFMDWAMHSSRAISCVMLKDKCLVLLLSIHANPMKS